MSGRSNKLPAAFLTLLRPPNCEDDFEAQSRASASNHFRRGRISCLEAEEITSMLRPSLLVFLMVGCRWWVVVGGCKGEGLRQLASIIRHCLSLGPLSLRNPHHCNSSSHYPTFITTTQALDIPHITMAMTDQYLLKGPRGGNARGDHKDGACFLRAAQECSRQGVSSSQ